MRIGTMLASVLAQHRRKLLSRSKEFPGTDQIRGAPVKYIVVLNEEKVEQASWRLNSTEITLSDMQVTLSGTYV